MRYLKNSALFILFTLTSCGTFDPNFFVGDYKNSQIISMSGQTVSCSDPNFNEYACIHQDDLEDYIDNNKSRSSKVKKGIKKYERKFKKTKTVRDR